MRSSRSRCSIDGTGLRPDNVAVAPETTFRLSEDTYLEPDIVICPRDSWPAGLSGGNVLLVVEIADSSLSYDMGRKAALYASFGVRELWVMDAVKLSTRMFHDPAANGYRKTGDFDASDRLAPLFASDVFALRLDELELT